MTGPAAPPLRAPLRLWLVVGGELAVLVTVLALEVATSFGNLPDVQSGVAIYVFLLGTIALATAIGWSVVRSQPDNPVGWLFITLTGVLVMTGVIDDTSWWVHVHHGDSAWSGVLAVVSDSDWIPWLVTIAWILYLTPTGTHLTNRWRWAARVTLWGGVVALVGGLFSHDDLSAPYEDVVNPLGHHPLGAALSWLSFAGAIAMALGLVGGAVSVIVRFRRSTGEARLQLLWLVVVLVPLPLFVVAAYVGAHYENSTVTLFATAGFVFGVPVGTGLAITRYRLYDVQRILTATATYTLLTLTLVGTYAFVVWAGASMAQQWEASPAVTATVGALAAAVLAAPLRAGIQRTLDRRFNRRSYDARRVVRAGLAQEDAGIDLEQLLRRALDDPTLTVSYPVGDGWVTATGAAPAASEAVVEVTRHGRLVARIGYDDSRVDSVTVTDAAGLARPELDNGRLRAELGHRVEELTASRRRLTTAQRRERRRIERDLHDGAQQSLLALAFDLQSAQVNGEPDRMRSALAQGTIAARDAVRELRALANGLHPAALADGGLTAALDDLARHSPVPLHLEVSARDRLDPAVEFTAWFVICESVVNAQKHAHAQAVEVHVTRHGDKLHLRVVDDGRGGANPEGPGLRGIRDRVDVARGTLAVHSDHHGTRVEAELPCGS